MATKTGVKQEIRSIGDVMSIVVEADDLLESIVDGDIAPVDITSAVAQVRAGLTLVRDFFKP